MSREQDIFQLPFRITEFNEDILLPLDRNFKEIERLLGNSQLYEKLVGKPNDEKQAMVESSVTYDSTGFRVYDNEDNLRAVLGQYAPGEFGIKIASGSDINGNSAEDLETEEGAQSKVDSHDGLESPHNLPSYTKMQSDGFKVFDDTDFLRAHLGQYTPGEYGLMLRDIQGKTIIDAEGIMQTWQEGRTDNVDSSHGLSLFVYVPEETREVKKCILRFRPLNFRSYGSASKDGGAISTTSETADSFSQTSSDAGGVSTSTESGGGQTSGSSSESSSGSSSRNTTFSGDEDISVDGYRAVSGPSVDQTMGAGEHNHGIPHNTGLEDVDENVHWFSGLGNHAHSLHPHEHYHTAYGHAHGMDHDHGIQHTHWVNSHSHDFSFSSHNHSVSIPGHDHDVYIPNHKHDIDHGIHVGGSAGGINVYINGIDRTSDLGGPWDSAQNKIDITDYIIIDHWNEIEITANGLGRIDATVFIQAIINTD